MQPKPFGRQYALLSGALAIAALLGCSGSTGPAGPAGQNGQNAPVAGYVIDAAALTSSQWIALNPKGTITGVTVDATHGQPAVNFTITDANGDGIKNLDQFTQLKASRDTVSSLPNFYFEIAKLVPPPAGSTAPSKWVSYICATTPNVANPTSVPQAPNADLNGKLVGHGDGTYTYTFYNDITKVASTVAAYGTANNVDVSALGDLSFQPSLTHRVSIEFYGNARGYGIGRHANTADGSDGPSNAEMANPINIQYDFVPATGKAVAAADTSREIVLLQSCNTCHTKFAYHGGHRLTPQNCVTCHTDQRKFGATEATRSADGLTFTSDESMVNGTAQLDFPQLIHQIHMGDALKMKGYTRAIDSLLSDFPNGLPINAVTYPQSVANCTTCHATAAAAPQAGNWKTAPSREACGACHDTTQFLNGVNHVPTSNFKVTDDTTCAQCHHADDIAAYHVPVTPPDLTNGGIPAANGGVASNTHTNSSAVAGNQSNLPTGAATMAYNLQSVTVNATNHPVFVFNILVNGQPAVFNNPASANEMITNFAGGPNLILGIGVIQDGISPNDFSTNASVNLHKLWRGAVAGSTLTGPDANGYYTATLGSIVVPTSSTVVYGGIGYFYGVAITSASAAYTPAKPNANTDVTAGDTFPFVQTNLPAYPYGSFTSNGTTVAQPYQGGLSVAIPNVWAVALKADGKTPYATRRTIVDENRCNACHENLGVFTESVFHAGQRNNAPTCAFCHNANSTGANGWPINIKEDVHSLHAGSMRTNPFTWQQSHTYWDVTYPAVLNNCEACHATGTYVPSQDAVAGMLWSTVATGKSTGSYLTDPTTYNPATTYLNPMVASGTDYGVKTTVNTTTAATATPFTWGVNLTPPLANVTVPSGQTLEADPATLVTSPITASCVACHDSSTAQLHMSQNGGKIAVSRASQYTSANGAMVAVGAGLKNTETCLVCHGTGKTADIQAVHMNF